MISTSEAARRIGVSTVRIRQLIADGQVPAERVGRAWMVDENALDGYAADAKGGRPNREEAARRRKARPRQYTLMSRNHEVARCAYDPLDRRFSRVELLDADRAPLALVGYRAAKGNLRNALNEWWSSRAVPGSRSNMDRRLGELQIDSTFQIPLRSRGLSMSDQYWLRAEGETVTWEEVSYYRNTFDLGPVNADGSVCSSADKWLNAVGLNSPDNTTDGMLDKRWIMGDDGQPVLIKGNGSSGREVYNEVIATMLYRRLLPSHRYVEYRLGSWRGTDVSACPSFLTDEEEFIPAWYVLLLEKKSQNHSEYEHYCLMAAKLGAFTAQNQLDRMLVCDQILANTDRHWGNFGLIRNIETLACRPAPIFDTGASLWTHTPIRSLANGDFRFTTKPFYEDPHRQLKLVCDDTWYHPEALEGFVDEVREYLGGIFPIANPADAICKGIEKRIEAVNAWAKRTPTHELPDDDRAATETLEWVWLR